VVKTFVLITTRLPFYQTPLKTPNPFTHLPTETPTFSTNPKKFFRLYLSHEAWKIKFSIIEYPKLSEKIDIHPPPDLLFRSQGFLYFSPLDGWVAPPPATTEHLKTTKRDTMTNNPEDGSLEAFVTHLRDQQKAAAEHAERHVNEVNELYGAVNGKKLKKREIEDFHSSFLGKKFKWLKNPEGFIEAIKAETLRTCSHINLMNPSIFYVNIFYPTAIGCVNCIKETAETFNKLNPNICDSCHEKNEIFHEAVFQIGPFVIHGSVCRTCHEKQSISYV